MRLCGAWDISSSHHTAACGNSLKARHTGTSVLTQFLLCIAVARTCRPIPCLTKASADRFLPGKSRADFEPPGRSLLASFAPLARRPYGFFLLHRYRSARAVASWGG